MGDQGYDDQFDNGIFRTSLHASARGRPTQWPKSTSEMRAYTDYGFGGMSEGHDTWHSDFMTRRPYNAMNGNTTAPPAVFHKPFWNDSANPKNGRVWNGYFGNQYHDPSYPTHWRWIDGSTR